MTSLEERIERLSDTAVRRMDPSGSRIRERVAPSGLFVPASYGNALGSDVRRAVRPLGLAALSASLIACGGEGGITPPPPSCDVNPIEDVAFAADVPYAWVQPLGEDCEVDADERWFVEDFLPQLRARTSDTIAQTYPERFVDDDNEFESDEHIVLSRYFNGRINHEGVRITPGYFDLFDANASDPETRLEIANASWVPIFALPFAEYVFPGFENNGYSAPYFPDADERSVDALYLPNRGGDLTFLDLLGSAIQPEPDVVRSDVSSNSQFIFAADQPLVNEQPHAMRVDEIQYLENFGADGTMVRNATVYFVPVYRSPSLGFSDLTSVIVHADADRLRIAEGDLVQPDEVWGYSELNLGGGIQIKWGVESSDGHVGTGDRFTNIDPWDPSFDAPESRALVPSVALYRSVDEGGNPTSLFYGALQSQAVKDGRAMSLDGVWSPLLYTKP